jgi:hypothetical protein
MQRRLYRQLSRDRSSALGPLGVSCARKVRVLIIVCADLAKVALRLCSDATNWSVDDVKKWLTNLGMEAYVPQFVENAISGEILLEMGTEDLDYMKITALGHRKVRGG